MSNKGTYESPSVVQQYAVMDDLQKPEQTILNIFKGRLRNMRMLDVGVGGGRTTTHFSRLVKEYVGIDYSENMIDACKKRFPNERKTRFEVADARSLASFKDGYFDFVLFSFNGLDYVGHEDRIKALKELTRVCKRGGVIVFSTHNVNFLDKLYVVKYSTNIVKMGWRILRYFIMISLNGRPKNLLKKDWVIVNDGVHKFGLKTYYIKPQAQIAQLKSLGLKDIHAYSLGDGSEIKESHLDEAKDVWVYYSCRV